MTASRAAVAVLAATVAVAACVACASGARPTKADAGEAGGPKPSVPVRVAPVRSATLEVLVSAPGRTTAIETQSVTAPFDGILQSLSVAEGDHVRTGQAIGDVVSIDSAAAVAGAHSMLRQARTPGERADAERALKVAERSRVTAALRVPETGVVVSRAAAEGDRVSLHQDIVKIAATDSIVFVADVVQTDLSRIRPGERARVVLPSRGRPRGGVVHGVLPTASSSDFTAPVRIDFTPPQPDLTLGLFGRADVVVALRPDATVVPEAAILRDDVTGVSRVAVLDANDHAHWVDVQTGVEQHGEVEIVGAAPSPGERVVVGGLVGLPEGAAVRVEP